LDKLQGPGVQLKDVLRSGYELARRALPFRDNCGCRTVAGVRRALRRGTQYPAVLRQITAGQRQRLVSRASSRC
jgi:hypothetical protein